MLHKDKILSFHLLAWFLCFYLEREKLLASNNIFFKIK